MSDGEPDSAPHTPPTSPDAIRAVTEALHGVIGAETVQEVGAAVGDAFADADRYRGAWLCSVHRSTGQVTVHGREDGAGMAGSGARFGPADEAAVAAVYRTGEPRTVADGADQPPVGLFPVPGGDEFPGCLVVQADGPDGFESAGRDALASLAGSIASRIDAIVERDRLGQTNERLEAFTRTVTHDLRNPLEVLSHSIELVAETEDIDHLDRCRDAADRMETLVQDLRVLAQQGEIVDDRREVEVSALVSDCWRTVETAGATLSVETDAKIRADRERLRQLFENLFRNAVEHGSTDTRAAADHDAPGDEPLTITVGATGGSLYVADDGCGIPAGEREAVFERGFSTGVDGSGFGLAIVEEIADAHGWTVVVADSEAGGARFDIRGVEFDR